MDSDKGLEWRETGRKEILRTRVFTVTERTSESPDGHKGTYIVNDAPDWVIVIPEHEGNFLMVRQWRHGELSLSTEFPGGVMDSGESPEEAARRELKEETGATAGKLSLLGSLNPNPALFSNHVHIFYATDLEFSGKQDLDADEFLHYAQMPKDEVLRRMGTKEFPHALMTAAMGLYMTRA
ncbi:MAG: NUDIX hydrolase [Treponema sp.]|nr:NUDIX hydrolase [Treponema sp.]